MRPWILLLLLVLLPARAADAQTATAPNWTVPAPHAGLKSGGLVNLAKLFTEYYRAKEDRDALAQERLKDQNELDVMKADCTQLSGQIADFEKTPPDPKLSKEEQDALKAALAEKKQAWVATQAKLQARATELNKALQDDVAARRKALSDDLTQEVNRVCSAHGVDVVLVPEKDSTPVSGASFSEVIPPDVDTGDIVDMTDTVLAQLEADHPDKYPSPAPAPPLPKQLSPILLDMNAVFNGLDLTKRDVADLKAKREQFQKELNGLNRDASRPREMELKKTLQEETNVRHWQIVAAITRAAGAYAEAHNGYLIDKSAITNTASPYPRMDPSSPGIASLPDITSELITEINAQSAAPSN